MIPDISKLVSMDKVYDYLAAGDPPLYIRLLLLNGIFLLFYFLRAFATRGPRRRLSDAVKATRMREAAPLVAALIFVSNGLVLFQDLIVWLFVYLFKLATEG